MTTTMTTTSTTSAATKKINGSKKNHSSSASSSAPSDCSSIASSYGSHVPEDKDQYLVKTPYGPAMVLRTRRDEHGAILMRELELLEWGGGEKEEEGPSSHFKGGSRRHQHRPATLYSPLPFPSIDPLVDAEVMTQFGRGKVIQVRPAETAENANTEAMVVIQLTNWRLAARGRVTCYLKASSVQVVRARKLYEMTVHEKVEYANQLKQLAGQQFAQKEYAAALLTYSKAIDAVRFVQHKTDSDNYVRADLLLIMVTCSNNAATCAKHVQQWDTAANFAKNAQVLLDALYLQRGKKIHSILTQAPTKQQQSAERLVDAKLFGEWRVKSLIIQARALAEKQETESAIEILKSAHAILAEYMTATNSNHANGAEAASLPNLLALEKEVKRLHITCKERRKAELKKEKQRAQAMFGGATKKKQPSRSDGQGDIEEKKEISETAPGQKQSSSSSSAAAITKASTTTTTKRSVSFSDTVQEKIFDANSSSSSSNEADRMTETERRRRQHGQPSNLDATDIYSTLAIGSFAAGMILIVWHFVLGGSSGGHRHHRMS